MLKITKKVFVSWSTGKDSAYALHLIRQSNQYEIVGLLSTVTEEYDRVAMHGTRHTLLKIQAERLGLTSYPILIPPTCSDDLYNTRMQEAMERMIKAEISHVIYGDLFLEEIRKYRETKLAHTNITPLFPLWGKNTTKLANEMIESGIKAIITCIDTKKLDASFAGRHFDQQLLKDLPKDVDPCGENGEFHTFVYDGPMFCRPIPITLGTTVERETYIYQDIIPTETA